MKTSMRVLLIVSLLCASMSAGKKATQKFRCDYTRVREIDGWLKYQEIPANWYNARLRCHMEGAILASPLNANLSRAMRSMVRANYINTAVFTGIHSTFSQGDYTSVEGIFLSDIPHTWAIGEPDDYEDKESCLVLLPDGTLADKECADPHPYLCYKKNENMVFSSCGTTDPDYKLDTRTGSCYKFHTVPRTWSRAYMNCMAEGGYLTIINSETEATVLRELFAKYPASVIPGNFWKDIAFIGFHDWNEHADWRTIHGQTLQEAGYNKFSGGEPDNSTTGEYCGSIFRTALLNDLWCNNYYAFICEKDPTSLVCDD